MTKIKIRGMSFDHCKIAVTKILNRIDGISNVLVDIEAGEASFEEERPIDLKDLKEKLKDAVYEIA